MDNANFNQYLPYVFLVIGLVLICISIFAKSYKAGLKETGVPVEGIIFEQTRENFTVSVADTDNSSNVNDKITVRFVTLEEKLWITAPIDQGFQFFLTGQYKIGDKVDVYYDKMNPYNFYVDMQTTDKIGKIVFGVAGVIFLAIGVFNLFS